MNKSELPSPKEARGPLISISSRGVDIMLVDIGGYTVETLSPDYARSLARLLVTAADEYDKLYVTSSEDLDDETN